MSGSFIKSSFSSAATCDEPAAASRIFPVQDYDLAATLNSGQAFRWHLREGWWEGVIGRRWVRLRAETDSVVSASDCGNHYALFPLTPALSRGEREKLSQRRDRSQRPGQEIPPPSPFPAQETPLLGDPEGVRTPPHTPFGHPLPRGGGEGRGEGGATRAKKSGNSLPGGKRRCEGAASDSTLPIRLIAETASPADDWRWLTHYLQAEQDLGSVLATFPGDAPMRAAVAACRGLRLLRQDPWECLASFILSSTKQIVQIRQIVARLCEQFGEQVIVPQNHEPAYAFPSAGCIAAAGEAELRACKMGFRAPNLRAAARMIAGGDVDLDRVSALSVHEARDTLMRLPGVGGKIADCVLLFAYGYPDAFPVDVWVMKALRRLYFPRRAVSLKRLQKFAATHFGPCAGYAQQYLFHYARVHAKLKATR